MKNKSPLLVKVVGMNPVNRERLMLKNGDVIVAHPLIGGLVKLLVKQVDGHVRPILLSPRGHGLWGFTIVVREVGSAEFDRGCLIASFRHLALMATVVKQKLMDNSRRRVLSRKVLGY